MTAVSSVAAEAKVLTPPSSSHGNDFWDFSSNHQQNTINGRGNASRYDQVQPAPSDSKPRKGHSVSSSITQPPMYFETGARKIRSVDNFRAGRSEQSGDGNDALSPPLAIEPNFSPISPPDEISNTDENTLEERRRHIEQTLGVEYSEEDSKWIHRDKLAKIESEELQAAGFILPRVRASSRQRRGRGQESVDLEHNRPRKDPATLHHQEEAYTTPHWDLRTPEEIAEEQESAYFASQEVKGGSRIPVAKLSPVPIPQDYLDRGSPSVRRIESFDGESIAFVKTRSRSASASTRDFDMLSHSNRAPVSKRSATETFGSTSPKKMASRKGSTTSKSSSAVGRPKTRSGPSKDFGGNRPSTRSGELSGAASKHPEGNPPWVFDTYKPDPRLPPDQQLLPTVAKRLRQEQWEKEGKYGDVYDKEFRPLNDHEFPLPHEREIPTESLPEKSRQEAEEAQQSADWPLKPDIAKSPKPSSYSTMPKISDTHSASPMASQVNQNTPVPAPTAKPHVQSLEPTAQGVESTKKKAGCGCCVIM